MVHAVHMVHKKKIMIYRLQVAAMFHSTAFKRHSKAFKSIIRLARTLTDSGCLAARQSGAVILD